MKFAFDKDNFNLVKEYIVKCFDGRNAIEYEDTSYSVNVEEEDLLEFKIAADDAIIAYGMVNQNSLTPLGCKLQTLYDEIIYQIHKRTE